MRNRGHLALVTPKNSQGESVGNSAVTGTADPCFTGEPVQSSPDPFTELVDLILARMEETDRKLLGWVSRRNA